MVYEIFIWNPFVSSDCWEEKSEERTYAYMNDIDKNLISDLIKPKRKMRLSQLTHNLFLNDLNERKYN